MNHMKIPKIVMSPEELSLELVNNPQALKREIRYIRGDGVDLPVRILDVPEEGAGSNVPLVISFHGGVSKDVVYPYFFGHRFISKDDTTPRTVLALCDPTLESGLNFGWYAGYSGVDVPRAIHNLLGAVVSKANPSRTIFVGGSTGAHAALRHVGSFPGALFLGLNPLPRISSYWRPAVDAFYETCWPGQYDPVTMTSPHVIDDAGDAYAGADPSNTFLVIQNPTDPHKFRQAVPMLEKLGRNPNMGPKVMAIMPFWADATGHGAPKGVFERWVEAAVVSSSTEPKVIALSFDRLEDSQGSQAKPNLINMDRALAQEIAGLARLETS